MMTEYEISAAAFSILDGFKERVNDKRIDDLTDDISECFRKHWHDEDPVGIQMVVIIYLGLDDCLDFTTQKDIKAIASTRIGLIVAALRDLNLSRVHQMPQPRY